MSASTYPVPLSGIQETITDAKGDIIAATAADAVARLAVGSNDTVLTADSSAATGLKWATVSGGGMTLLASGSLAAAQTGVDLTSISQAYNDLMLVASGLSFTSINENVWVRFNGDTGANYYWHQAYTSNTVNGTNGANEIAVAQQTDTTPTINQIIMRFPNYTDTTSGQIVESSGWIGNHITNGAGFWKTASAITQITFLVGGFAFDAGTYKLFGVK
jgi:hypothetical protein